jgi:hypothetical protein
MPLNPQMLQMLAQNMQAAMAGQRRSGGQPPQAGPQMGPQRAASTQMQGSQGHNALMQALMQRRALMANNGMANNGMQPQAAPQAMGSMNPYAAMAMQMMQMMNRMGGGRPGAP